MLAITPKFGDLARVLAVLAAVPTERTALGDKTLTSGVRALFL
jgi:hypothetical protein